MPIDREEAGASLIEIDAIVRRVKQSATYRASSVLLMFWGAIVIVGDVAAMFAGRWTGWAWTALDLLGILGTVVLLARARTGAHLAPRILMVFALFVGFGFVWATLLGRSGPRELAAFWPTLFLFGYALAGLWFGRAFTIIGVALAALVVAGFFWTGEAFDLYLAVVNGGGLILCGLWMRRA